MPGVLEIVFWASLLALVYGYVGFPLLIAVAGKLRNRTVRQAPITPTVSLIIAAYNEEDAIAERLDNALSVDYPREALEILVASDGSTDATASIVARYESRGVRLLDLARQGKIPALNEAVRQATGEIVVFSDANIHFHPHALRALVRNFADPQVGGVAGNTTYRLPADGESSSKGEGLYWRYDSWLKEMETKTGSIISAHGGMYAIRRSLFRPLTDTAVTDDFAISTGVVEQGWRLVFDSEALAYELAIGEANREFRRKVRLMTRAWRSVRLRRALLNPLRYGFYSVTFFSHKVLRRLLPLALLLVLLSSAVLASEGGLYLAAAGGQVLFYGLATLGYFTKGSRAGRGKAVYIPFYYCMANVAALLALLKFVRGERIALWQPQRHPARAQS